MVADDGDVSFERRGVGGQLLDVPSLQRLQARIQQRLAAQSR